MLPLTPVVCFAHVTNQMGQIEGDFEKGRSNGTYDSLAIIYRTAALLRKGTVNLGNL